MLIVLSIYGQAPYLGRADSEPTRTPSTNELIQEYANKYGVNYRLALSIATCESHLKQFDASGNVQRGELNHQDVGLFQINEKYHLATSQKLGMNIYTAEGNVNYAMWLMSKEGSTPWNWSKPCWSSLAND